MGLALGLYGLAGLLGIYICACSSWWLLLIGAFCMLIGYLYTGGPFPISASPFGELFAGGFLGTGVICIAFFIQTGYLTWHTVAISIPVMVLIGLILTGNNIRDRVGDAANGRHTLVILLGHKRSVQFLAVMFAFCYVWIVGLILFGGHSIWLLAIFLSIPTARKAVEKFRPEGQTPQQMMAAMVLFPKPIRNLVWPWHWDFCWRPFSHCEHWRADHKTDNKRDDIPVFPIRRIVSFYFTSAIAFILPAVLTSALQHQVRASAVSG